VLVGVLGCQQVDRDPGRAKITLRSSGTRNRWSYLVFDLPRGRYFSTEVEDDCEPVAEKP
jgi:hypothetical protein